MARGKRIAIPAERRSTAGLSGAGYSWAYEFPAPKANTLAAEQWARAVFEDAPPLMRAFLIFGWKVGLGLRLGPRTSRTHILGWSIQRADTREVTLEAESRIVRAQNTVLVGDATVIWITEVRYHRLLGHAVWAVAKPIHQLVIPASLARVDRRRTPTEDSASQA